MGKELKHTFCRDSVRMLAIHRLIVNAVAAVVSVRALHASRATPPIADRAAPAAQAR